MFAALYCSSYRRANEVARVRLLRTILVEWLQTIKGGVLMIIGVQNHLSVCIPQVLLHHGLALLHFH